MSKKFEKRLELGDAVTLVGGAGFSKTLLSKSLALTNDLIAADGGANFLPTHTVPKYIIGDLDSIRSPEKWVGKGSELIKIEDQDSTDFDKCTSLIKSKKIIALGFMDQRLDHFLAVCSSLVKNRRVIFVVGKRDVIFHLPNDLSIKLPVNSRVSLFPLKEISIDDMRKCFYDLQKFDTSSICIPNEEVLAEVVKYCLEGAAVLASS